MEKDRQKQIKKLIILQSNLLGKILFFTVIFFFGYSAVNLYLANYFECIAELIIGLLFIIIYQINKSNVKYYSINVRAGLILIQIFYLLILCRGGIGNRGAYWLYTFLLVTMFTSSKKEAIYWNLFFFAWIIGLAVLQYAGIISIAVSSGTIIYVASTLLVGLLFIIAYKSIMERSQIIIYEKNIALAESTDNLQKEIKFKEIAQKKLQDTLNVLKDKNRFSEDTKKAMVNLLEDVDEERKISLSRADDLQKFKLAVENASDQIIITDEKTKIIYANRAAEQITGFAREDLIGETPALWGRQMDDKFYKNMYKTIKTYKTVFTDEFSNLRKNGQTYIANVYISPILDKENKVKYYIGIERDITHEKEVDKAKTEFVSLASHQLRTPLSAINWYTEMILNGDAGKVTKEQKNYLTEIFNGSKRMSDLVSALLNVSRIELGTFVINPKKTDLIEIIDNVVKEITPLVQKKNVTINKKYFSKKLILNVDRGLTRIIFQNLISNAVKYNKDNGKVTIEISKQKKYVNIKITDTGLGIPKDQQDKIFTKLFRAENVKQQDTEGTGLGLYIVKSIIKQAGGMVWFKSKENQGTTFYVAMPVKGMKKKIGTKKLG